MQGIVDSGSKVLPFSMILDEISFMSYLKNKKIPSIVEKPAVTAEKALLDEIHDKTKETEKSLQCRDIVLLGGKVS